MTIDKYLENPSFCSMAWCHQFLDPTGRVKPCCRFRENERPPENHLDHQSIEDIFYGDWMHDLRDKMLKGERIPGCKRCYQEEDAGKTSLRQRYHLLEDLPVREILDLDSPKIKWLELALSNECNLACRMCDSRYSKKWFKEEKEVYGRTFSTKEFTSTDMDQIRPFLDDILHIKFTGGEPLLIKEHWEILDYLIKNRDCSKIFLNYSTNCTIFPKQEWFEIWDKFKHVEFALSLDSVDKYENEYIRWPAKDEIIKNTTSQFLIKSKESKNIITILRTTVSILNVYHLPETIQWATDIFGENLKINPTHLTFPEILSVSVLPKQDKLKVVEKFENYVKGKSEPLYSSLDYIKNLMLSEEREDLIPALKQYILKTDKYRNQDFKSYYTYFPELLKRIY